MKRLTEKELRELRAITQSSTISFLERRNPRMYRMINGEIADVIDEALAYRRALKGIALILTPYAGMPERTAGKAYILARKALSSPAARNRRSKK